MYNNHSEGNIEEINQVDNTKYQRLASWIFGGFSFLFLIGVFIFSPESLPAFKHKILAIISAILCGLFTYFFTGTIKLDAKFPKIGIVLRAAGGVAMFLVVLFWYNSDYAPVRSVDEGTIIYLENIRSMKTSFSNPHNITQQPIVFKWKSGEATFSLYKRGKAIIEDKRHTSPFELKKLEPDIYLLKTNLKSEMFNLSFEIVNDKRSR